MAKLTREEFELATKLVISMTAGNTLNGYNDREYERLWENAIRLAKIRDSVVEKTGGVYPDPRS